MSMLTIVQAAQRRLGLAVASTVAGNSDDTATQLLALLNQAGEELCEAYAWQAITKEATFTTLAAESQGLMETIAPGWLYIVNDTIWNRSRNQPVKGGLSSQEWQQQKSSNVTGPFSQYRIRQGYLRFLPTPAAGDTCAFEYVSKHWATDSTGATGKSAFTVDTDLPVLDDQLLTLALVWRFKQANGLDWAAEYQMYENRLNNAMARDGGKPVIRLDGERLMGLGIPDGNFTL